MFQAYKVCTHQLILCFTDSAVNKSTLCVFILAFFVVSLCISNTCLEQGVWNSTFPQGLEAMEQVVSMPSNPLMMICRMEQG